MTQKDFIKLSKEQVEQINRVKQLNNGRNETEGAWRAGYLHLAYKIHKYLNEKPHDEFIKEMRTIAANACHLFEFE